MRRSTLVSILFGATALATAGLAVAQEGEDPKALALEMRHGHMLQFAANLSVLGGMAQGNAEYDAAAAQTAADNLAHLSAVQWGYMWPEGTAVGEIEDSAAKPEIWTDMAGFEAKHQALIDAATALQAAAGTDLASLQGAMQGVGAACGGCHQAYRAQES